MIAFDNSYARLPDRFRARLDPVPVAAPSMIAWNAGLADEMGLPDLSNRPDIWAGNAVPEGAEPVAQAYAGHQFGGFVPQLGDGRALLLGEVESGGRRYDIQLKGSGPTPFSRRGDGRAWLGPVLREYVVSEAMHALGIPTTRALAAARTGETVMRERPLPGAVLTRVAPSHLRVGTFEYFAARRDEEALLTLTDLAIVRHHPGAEGPKGFLAAAIAAQAKLVAAWMSVGFVHGVMNTDNAHVGGITIDYGPCAFLDRYHPATVFSSIDRQGRYAYASQPQMAVWNMAQLANALLPIMGGEAAVDEITGIVHGFADIYQAEWLRLFGRKIGIEAAGEDDADLIHDLLDRMAAGEADFTNTFRALAAGDPAPAFARPEALEGWTDRWRERIASETGPEALMLRANPAIIPRNHRIEAMIEAAAAGDMGPFERLMTALADPYAPDAELALPPAPGEVVTATFCGT